VDIVVITNFPDGDPFGDVAVAVVGGTDSSADVAKAAYLVAESVTRAGLRIDAGGGVLNATRMMLKHLSQKGARFQAALDAYLGTEHATAGEFDKTDGGTVF
jgi:hypothetical protein